MRWQFCRHNTERLIKKKCLFITHNSTSNTLWKRSNFMSLRQTLKEKISVGSVLSREVRPWYWCIFSSMRTWYWSRCIPVCFLLLCHHTIGHMYCFNYCILYVLIQKLTFKTILYNGNNYWRKYWQLAPVSSTWMPFCFELLSYT